MAIKVPSLTRIYRYIRFRKGYGVHSPFAFGLINKVIEEKRAFYVFEEIEKNYSRQYPSRKFSKKYGRLLFRLVNFFSAKTVLQIGVSEGWQAMYLHAAAHRLLVLDEDQDKLDAASKLNCDSKGLHSIPGWDLASVGKGMEALGTLDLLYLNVSHDEELTRSLFDRCLAYAHSDTVFIIDGIHKKRMKKCWRYIQERKDVPITMDLYSLGLVFFNRKMHKKNYKLFF